MGMIDGGEALSGAYGRQGLDRSLGWSAVFLAVAMGVWGPGMGFRWLAAVETSLAFDSPFFLSMTVLVFGAAACCGLVEGVWVGRVSAGSGRRPWAVLPGGRGRSAWRRKEEAGCWRYLLGESKAGR